MPYTRCTTLVDALDDKYNLGRWQQRMVAIGLADRPDLLLAVAAHRSDKQALNKITEQALAAAQAGAAATVGTALHALADRIDRGQPLGVIPAAYEADLRAYEERTKPLQVKTIEEFCVLDDLRVAGTCDRVVAYGGHYYIADTKSGSIDWGGLKIAQQLAVYAHSVPYDPATHQRVPRQFTVDTDWAIVIHLPAGQGRCELKWVNIAAGWQAVQTSVLVRELRSRKDWFIDFDHLQPHPVSDLADRLRAATSVDVLRQLWTRAIAEGTWTGEHLTIALARKAELEGQS
ncbi:MAG TPA: hypothetical protein VFX53_04575 [Pedococcus sp.]|nr:hypothetical protein [Pedococcus sp.]